MTGERPESGVEPVDGFTAGQHPVDDVARGPNPEQSRIVEVDAGVAAGDGEDVINRQSIPTEGDCPVG